MLTVPPFGITRYDTDNLSTYQRHLDPKVHCSGKRYTQPIERQHLTLVS
jgi:IS1 family transposase